MSLGFNFNFVWPLPRTRPPSCWLCICTLGSRQIKNNRHWKSPHSIIRDAALLMLSSTISSLTLTSLGSVHELGLFERFKLDFHRSYESVAEELRRFSIFQETVRLIEKRNKLEADLNPRADRAVHGITKFADRTPAEFQQSFGLSVRPGLTNVSPYLPVSPANCSRNWAIKSNYNVRNQLACEGCWSYAIAETIRDTYIALFDEDPGLLSTNFLLDCATPAWTAPSCSASVWGKDTTVYHGCCGGDPFVGINWLNYAGGIPSAETYGGMINSSEYGYVSELAMYPNVSQSCNNAGVASAVGVTGPPAIILGSGLFNMTPEILRAEQTAAAEGGIIEVRTMMCNNYGICPVNRTGSPEGWEYLSPEPVIMQHVHDASPVGIGICGDSAQTYVSGVISAATCCNTTSHSVQIVGIDESKQAWIVSATHLCQYCVCMHYRAGCSPVPYCCCRSATRGEAIGACNLRLRTRHISRATQAVGTCCCLMERTPARWPL